MDVKTNSKCIDSADINRQKRIHLGAVNEIGDGDKFFRQPASFRRGKPNVADRDSDPLKTLISRHMLISGVVTATGATHRKMGSARLDRRMKPLTSLGIDRAHNQHNGRTGAM